MTTPIDPKMIGEVVGLAQIIGRLEAASSVLRAAREHVLLTDAQKDTLRAATHQIQLLQIQLEAAIEVKADIL